MSTRSRTNGSPDATRAVDWEQRLDFPRLRRERLERARASLERSELGAVLLFDPNNIRYVTSTHIGEWARDKNARFTLLARGRRPDPLGLRLRRPPPPDVRALASRGELPRRRLADAGRDARRDGHPRPARREDRPRVARAGAPRRAARRRHGGSRHPGGAAARRAPRHGRLEGSPRGPHDQDGGRDRAARPVGGPRRRGLRRDLPDAPSRACTSTRSSAARTSCLFEMGSEQVEAVNAVSGDRCNPHPHVFSDRLLRPGDQAFFDIIHSFMGYRTCYYRTFNIGGVSPSQLDAYKQCREWLDAAIALVAARHDHRSDRGGVADGRGARVPRRGDVLRPPVRARDRRRPLRVADDLARPLARGAGRARGRDGVRARDVLRGDRRALGGADRGGGRRHGDGLRRDHPLPGRGAARRGPPVRARRRPPARPGRDFDRQRRRLGARRRRGVVRSRSSRRASPVERRDRHARPRGRTARLPARPARGRGARRRAARTLDRPDHVPARRRDARLDAHGAHARLARRRARRRAPALLRDELLRARGRARAVPRGTRREAPAGRVWRDPRRDAPRVPQRRARALDRDGVAAAADRRERHVLPRAWLRTPRRTRSTRAIPATTTSSSSRRARWTSRR